jgi:aspartyl-tRNA(Asn)/glutamyl-tRNA(Gln) amidotransferase subunit A
MDEFAFGSSTEKSAYGPTKNPYDTSRVPGGTSGGSAVAVAAHMAPIALGSDTGGSIRQPASFCNVLGLKTTYGAVSRSGLIAAASSFDQIGGLARTAGDLELLYGVIAGHDPKDGTTLPDSARAKKEFERGKTIGVPRKFLANGVDSKILERFEVALATLSGKGYRIVDIEIPNIDYALATYYILIFAEEATNLSRFDGMRYGLHTEAKMLADEYKKSRSAGFGWEVKRRIILGTYILSHGYYDAYYRRATALRGLLVKDFDAAFSKVDAIAMPTSPVLPFKFGEKDADPLSMYLADIFTVPINVVGVPAISVPAGFAEHEGAKLPVGIQFVAQKLCEDKLFRIARDVLGEPLS